MSNGASSPRSSPSPAPPAAAPRSPSRIVLDGILWKIRNGLAWYYDTRQLSTALVFARLIAKRLTPRYPFIVK